MKKLILVVLSIVLALFLVYNSRTSADLIIYSGRSKALVDPVVQKFENQTGLRVQVKYGGTTQLAVALMEEGTRTPADLFWAQDAGALGAVGRAGVLRELPSDILDIVPDGLRNSSGNWVATSGRARVLAYSTSRASSGEVPESVFDLADERYKGRIAWAPANGSFQSFVSAMIQAYGYDATRDWLYAIRNNEAKNYANNNAILQGIAAGEADFGITNHYYLYRLRAENPTFPVENGFFAAGDIGNMINYAGIAQTVQTRNQDAAEQFIHFLLADEIQAWFVSEVHEYPAVQGLQVSTDESFSADLAPEIDLESLSNLEETLQLLREVGLL